MDVLVCIKRKRDGLSVEDVLEWIVSATAIKKVLRSRSSARLRRKERFYVIESSTFLGTWVYTKGTVRRKGRKKVSYVFVSAKLAA